MSAPRPPFATRMGLRLLAIMILIGEALIRATSRFGNQPYIDAREFPWTQQLEQSWDAISAELDGLLTEPDSIPDFHEISPEQRVLGIDDQWKSFVFFVFGTPIQSNCAVCPETAALLKQIPGLGNAMFSILGPNRSIPEHRGPYKGLLRYHLGLRIPTGQDKLAITVNGVEHGWRDRETLILDDSYPHSVRNDSSATRVILFADFERPLLWPVSLYNRLVIALLKRTPLAQEPIARLNGDISGKRSTRA